MGDWAVTPGIVFGTTCGLGTAVASSASSNTKGSWVQLTDATAFNVSLLIFRAENIEPTYDYLIDIGIGGAGSEQVILSNLIRSAGSATFLDAIPFYAPIQIPAGSRIATRIQCSTGSKTMYCSLSYYAASFLKSPLSVCETYGANTADSGGTVVDCGGSAWSFGSYSQITASTLRDHKGIIVGLGNILNTGRAVTNFYFQIAIGGAGSEVVLFEVVCGFTAISSTPTPNFSVFYPINIPAGSRLAVRAKCGTADATDRLVDVVLYCFS